MIETISGNITSNKLKIMFTNCYPNTLDTTVYYTDNYNNTGDPDTFIITGLVFLFNLSFEKEIFMQCGEEIL